MSDRLFGVPGRWDLERCTNANCHLMWINPMPLAEDTDKLYATYYTHKASRQAKRNVGAALRRGMKHEVLSHAFGYPRRPAGLAAAVGGSVLSRGRHVREWVGRGIMWLDGPPGRLLDIGCGNGSFLARMRETGWDVTGVEQDTRSAEVGRRVHGLRIETGVIEDLDLPRDYYDAVTFIHVIEHLPDPLATLRVVHSLLKRGGRVVIATPNSTSLGHRWFRGSWFPLEPPRHLHLFSPPSIASLVRRAHFQISSSRTCAVGASTVWSRSSVIKHADRFPGENPNDAVGKHYRLSGALFGAVESVLTGWPFRLPWGEEAVVTAVKR